VIQIRHVSPSVLRLIARAHALDARAKNHASSPAECVVARRECEALCETHALTVTRMHVPVPEGVTTSGSSDTLLTLAGVPWWRAQLALLGAMYAGFGAPKARPWESDDDEWFVSLVGTRRAVALARVVYATAEAVTVSFARFAPKGRLDEYLCGVVLAIGFAFELEHERERVERQQFDDEFFGPSDAMVLYQEPLQEGPMSEDESHKVPVKPQHGELNIMAVAQDPFHPVRMGFDMAKKLQAGEQVLGYRPPPPSKFGNILGSIFGGR
jgi:hypothetical protein